MILGCTRHAPINITNDIQYEIDVNWCLNHNSQTETYKQCMETRGYKYQ